VNAWPQKIDHIGIRVTDIAAAKKFYAAALAPINIGLISASNQHAAFGMGPMPYLILRLADGVASPVHLAFLADQRADVDAFHAAALAAGGHDNGAPGLRPDYHPHYYGAFVLDPDGHNIEVVKHDPE
jgi:catechol 2,3-dioxygenase-like lactoylglutathione lyase family enzyme